MFYLTCCSTCSIMAGVIGLEPTCIQLPFQQLRRQRGYTPMINCLNCNKETNNPKFCSRSCSATYTNKHYPKKKTKKICTWCTESVISWRHSHCHKHLLEYKEGKYSALTIGEYRNKQSVKGKHPSWIHAHVRQFARSWLKELVNQPCRHCGYDKHIELAHIKNVASFPDSALLREVNSIDNVLPLCPNCHWEFDNLPR